VLLGHGLNIDTNLGEAYCSRNLSGPPTRNTTRSTTRSTTRKKSCILPKFAPKDVKRSIGHMKRLNVHFSLALCMRGQNAERRLLETIITIWPGDPPSPCEIAGQVAEWVFDLQTHGASSTSPRAASKLSSACQV
jgi:hypothetical protein